MNKRIRKKRVRRILLAQLSARFASEDEAIAWLESAHPSLDGRTPREAINEGEIDRVSRALDALDPPSARRES